MRRLLVFFHIATIGNYRDIVSEVLCDLTTCGLFERLSALYVGIVGTGEVRGLDIPKVSLLYRSADLTRFEFETLKRLQEIAQHDPNCLALYIHTKGCSVRPEHAAAARDWRRYMLHFLVERFRECEASLADHDVCGVDWRTEPLPHFSGNFWWARGDHLAALPPVASVSAPNALWTISPRHNAEFWVGMKAGTSVRSLFDCGISVYERYQYRLYPLTYRNGHDRFGVLGRTSMNLQRARRKANSLLGWARARLDGARRRANALLRRV